MHDYDERVEYIRKHKPEEEQGLRLHLFKMIPNDGIPEPLLKARGVYDEAWDVYDKTRDAYDKALAKHLPYLEELHKELCPDCPFDNGTIFNGVTNET